MICKIDYKKKRDGILEHCLNKLPHSIKYKLLDFLEKNPYKTINEIRLHRNSNIMLIADSKNVKTDIYFKTESVFLTFIITFSKKLGSKDSRTGNTSENTEIKYKNQLVCNGYAGHLFRTDLTYHNIV